MHIAEWPGYLEKVFLNPAIFSSENKVVVTDVKNHFLFEVGGCIAFRVARVRVSSLLFFLLFDACFCGA